jgi:hypothetical protein
MLLLLLLLLLLLTELNGNCLAMRVSSASMGTLHTPVPHPEKASQ